MNWLQWILSFLGVLGLIFFLFYAIRKLNKGIAVKSGNKLRVLDRINLGRDGMLLVVSVCGRLMLLGVTAQRVDKLCDLDMTEGEYLQSLSEEGSQGMDFKAALLAVMGKKQQETEVDKADDNTSEKSDTTE